MAAGDRVTAESDFERDATSLVCRRPVQVALAVASLHVLTSANGCDSAECQTATERVDQS